VQRVWERPSLVDPDDGRAADPFADLPSVDLDEREHPRRLRR
jgi:hypothetical protein